MSRTPATSSWSNRSLDPLSKVRGPQLVSSGNRGRAAVLGASAQAAGGWAQGQSLWAVPGPGRGRGAPGGAGGPWGSASLVLATPFHWDTVTPCPRDPCPALLQHAAEDPGLDSQEKG